MYAKYIMFNRFETFISEKMADVLIKTSCQNNCNTLTLIFGPVTNTTSKCTFNRKLKRQCVQYETFETCKLIESEKIMTKEIYL